MSNLILKVVVAGVAVCTVAVAVLLWQGTNRGRFELARRAQCAHQLNLVCSNLLSSGIRIEEAHQGKVASALEALDFVCPSGNLLGDRSAAAYRMTTNVYGEWIITEDIKNHDPSLLHCRGLRPVIFSLHSDGRVQTVYVVRGAK